MKAKTNFVFLLPDQMRADFLSCYGANFLETPNIDRIGRQGVRYERAYCPSPLCVPARVSLLTGMNAIKNGVLDNSQFLRPDYRQCGIEVWPEILQENGYSTCAVGKMHFYPWDIAMGFERRVIAEDKRWPGIRDDYAAFLARGGLRKLHGKEHPGYFEHKGAIASRIPWEYSVDHFVGEQACSFLRDYRAEKPFALMVGFPGPHCPYDPCPEFLDGLNQEDMPESIPEAEGDLAGLRRTNIATNLRPWNGVDYSEFSEDQKKKIRLHYAALIKQIDMEVGQILDTLEERGLADETAVIFSSDHGDYLGDHNLIGKGSFYESSIRVPLLLRLPGGGKPATCSNLVSLGDITSTILHLAGCRVPSRMDSLPLPGIGIGRSDRPRESIVGMLSDGWMVTDGKWKLARYVTGESHLFNVIEDPSEQDNLFRSGYDPEIVRGLDGILYREIMPSIRVSHQDKTAFVAPPTEDKAFGEGGWVREYPFRTT